MSRSRLSGPIVASILEKSFRNSKTSLISDANMVHIINRNELLSGTYERYYFCQRPLGSYARNLTYTTYRNQPGLYNSIACDDCMNVYSMEFDTKIIVDRDGDWFDV